MKKILRFLFKKKKVPLTVYKGVLPISDYDGMGNFSRIGKP
jgi:hypothetical protein